MKCKSRGCYGVFLIPSLTLGVLPCWCPWYDGRVQGREGETLVMALMAAMRTMATMITVMMFAAKVTKITTWLQAAARGSLARLQYIKLRWESYLIFVTNAANAVRVNFLAQCKKIPEKRENYCFGLRLYRSSNVLFYTKCVILHSVCNFTLSV